MIKAVIFDVGGVLVDYDMPKNLDLLKDELGIDQATAEKIFWERLMDGPSLGMDEADFWQRISKEFHLRTISPNEQLLRRTFEKTIKPIDSMMQFVELLKKRGLKVAILSNTVAPHAEALIDIGIYAPFKHTVLSYQVKLRKPDPAIFEYTLKLLGVAPEEAVFIDDAEKNIAGAQAVGIHGVLAKDSQQVQDDVLRLIG